MQFDVIDTKTGAYPDVGKIALTEDWAKGLIYCDIDCFAIQEDGNLILIDDCGNIAYPPEGRFEIVPEKEQNEPLSIEQLRQMKDEPAYLKVFDPLLESGWHIIKAVTESKIIFRGWQTVYVPIDGMGLDYNLYRRPPEGET